MALSVHKQVDIIVAVFSYMLWKVTIFYDMEDKQWTLQRQYQPSDEDYNENF